MIVHVFDDCDYFVSVLKVYHKKININENIDDWDLGDHGASHVLIFPESGIWAMHLTGQYFVNFVKDVFFTLVEELLRLALDYLV